MSKNENIINNLLDYDWWYYNTGNPLITDLEYDRLKEKARKLYPTNDYFKTVGSDPVGKDVDLPYILGSLTKTKPDGSLRSWIESNKISNIVISDKLDGISIYAKYVDGSLVKASTRGNGYKGKDITDKVKIIQPTINTKETVELRGEALLTQELCNHLGYSLPRSAVSGIMNGEEQKHFDMCKHIEIVWYNVFNKDFKKYSDHFDFIKEIGLVHVNYEFVYDIRSIEEFMTDIYLKRKSNSKFDIDGLVVTNLIDASVGDDYYPTNSVAFKVNEDAVYTYVTDINWNVTRTGKVTPIVQFDTIRINGSNVSKATGFNKKFIIDNSINIGAEIGIVKSGDIIPYIVDVKSKSNNIDIPTTCPSCGSILHESKTGVDLFCVKSDTCIDQQLYKIEHFLLSHDVEDISVSTIKKLGVSCIEDLYELTKLDISMIEGMGDRKAEIILEQLKKTLNTTQEKMLKSFGIDGIGNTMSNLLINTFGDIDTLMTKEYDDFIKIDGMGDVLVFNILSGLKKNRELYDFLKSKGLRFDQKVSMSFKGKIFTLTGKSDISRNDLTKMIVSHGGMVKGISKNVNYLVTNDMNSQSSKMKKALQYGIEIISYDKLINIINEVNE